MTFPHNTLIIMKISYDCTIWKLIFNFGLIYKPNSKWIAKWRHSIMFLILFHLYVWMSKYRLRYPEWAGTLWLVWKLGWIKFSMALRLYEFYFVFNFFCWVLNLLFKYNYILNWTIYKTVLKNNLIPARPTLPLP